MRAVSFELKPLVNSKRSFLPRILSILHCFNSSELSSGQWTVESASKFNNLLCIYVCWLLLLLRQSILAVNKIHCQFIVARWQKKEKQKNVINPKKEEKRKTVIKQLIFMVPTFSSWRASRSGRVIVNTSCNGVHDTQSYIHTHTNKRENNTC